MNHNTSAQCHTENGEVFITDQSGNGHHSKQRTMKTKEQKSKPSKPSVATLKKMGFTISGNWAHRHRFNVYRPTLTYNKLFEEIQSYGENIGKNEKLNEIKQALGICQ